MEIAHVLAFNLALFAAIVSPGPAFLIAVQTTLSSGRRAGIATGVGLGVVAALWTTAALFGLDVFFSLFPWAYVLAKAIGAIYLLYVAYGMWRGAGEAIKTNTKPAARALKQGLMVNVLNPKSVLFAAAVLSVVFPAKMTPWENVFIIMNHFVFEVGFYSVLAFAMSRKAVSDRYMAMKSSIDRFSSVILGTLGARLLIDR